MRTSLLHASLLLTSTLLPSCASPSVDAPELSVTPSALDWVVVAGANPEIQLVTRPARARS